MTLEHTMQEVAPVGHATSLTALALAWAGVLSPLLTVIATFFTAVWVMICVWESETCKGWRTGLRHWKNNTIMTHRARKLAKLTALKLRTEAKILAEAKLSMARSDARDLVAEAATKAALVVAQEPVATAAKLTPPLN
jgi:hypothetical protein